jgi:hypothetical protein
MNLAYRDIRHNLLRFVLTCFGLGLLLGIVITMAGIYRGALDDALRLVSLDILARDQSPVGMCCSLSHFENLLGLTSGGSTFRRHGPFRLVIRSQAHI